MKVPQLTDELLKQILESQSSRITNNECSTVDRILTPEYVANFNRGLAYRIRSAHSKSNYADSSLLNKPFI